MDDPNYRPVQGVAYIVTAELHGHGYEVGNIIYLADGAKYNGPFTDPQGVVGPRPYLNPDEYDFAPSDIPLSTIEDIEQFLKEG